MNPPPPCVSRSSPEWAKYRFSIWQKNNREYMNYYSRRFYHRNAAKLNERKRLYYHNVKKFCKQITPEEAAAKIESDRKYREEMAAKGFIL